MSKVTIARDNVDLFYRALKQGLNFADKPSNGIPSTAAVNVSVKGDTMKVSATDRFVAGVWFVPVDNHDGATIEYTMEYDSLKASLQAMKPVAKTPFEYVLTFDETGATFMRWETSMGMSGSIGASADNPPPITKVIENAISSVRTNSESQVGANTFAQYKPDKLAKFKLVGGRADYLVVYHGTPGKATVVTSGDTFIGVIMPLRLDPDHMPKAMVNWQRRLADF